MSAPAKTEQTIRAWFDADGWRLEADELRDELGRRGADDDLVVELIDEGADRRRRQPVTLGEGVTDANISTSGGTPAQVGAPSPSAQVARREHGQLAPVVPISKGNVPPQNLEAEESVLGSMMISPGSISACAEILNGGEFYFESHSKIWRACIALDERGEPVDVITLTNWLEQSGELEAIGGRVRLHELAALVPASANAAHYARIVRETATLRGLIRAGGEISRLGWDRPGDAVDLVDEAQQITFGLGDGPADSTADHLNDVLKGTFAKIAEQYETGATMTGLATGFKAIDDLTQGFEPGNLIIIAARPSMGKSALVHAMLANIAVRQGLPVGLFTLEMSKSEVAKRLLAREAHVNLKHLKGGIQAEEWPRLMHAANALSQAPIFLDDTGDLRLARVRSVGRKLKLKHPTLAALVVDYLQLMSSEGENRTQEVSKLSRGLKVLARELEVPIIALSQLSRKCEERANKRPLLSDLRESGTIEQDADLVAFVYREEQYDPDTDQQGIAEIIVAKHRNGPTDTVKLSFQKRSATFTDLAGMWTT